MPSSRSLTSRISSIHTRDLLRKASASDVSSRPRPRRDSTSRRPSGNCGVSRLTPTRGRRMWQFHAAGWAASCSRIASTTCATILAADETLLAKAANMSKKRSAVSGLKKGCFREMSKMAVAGVLDPQGALGRAEAAAAHEVAPRAAHVAVGGGAAAGKDPEVGVGGHHAQGGGHGAAPALRGLDIGRVGEVLEPKVLAPGVPADGALVDGEDARLARVLGDDVADLHALAALGAEGLEGVLPLGVGAEVVGFGAGGEDAVLEVAALLDDGADLILGELDIALPMLCVCTAHG
ncbi:hypothetical protein ColKHC_08853 [Colletotrichum higginsianum]|nr:hypothetical protein ColKHC_08853 [Colletotrichum higginsianum]